MPELAERLRAGANDDEAGRGVPGVPVRCGIEPAAHTQPRPVLAHDVDGELLADSNTDAAAGSSASTTGRR